MAKKKCNKNHDISTNRDTHHNIDAQVVVLYFKKIYTLKKNSLVITYLCNLNHTA